MVGILAALQPSLKHRLAIAYVDHGLRDGREDLAAVSDAARRFQVSLHQRRVDLAAGPNLQGRAREARYSALAEMRDAAGMDHIATAHHSDDQAETFLMRASRGAGKQALLAAAPIAGDVVRPLLCVDREQLARFAAEEGLLWREDPSNADRRHTRNAVRHDVLPALRRAIPGATHGIARTVEALRGSGAQRHWLSIVLADHGQLSHDRAGVTTALSFPLDLLPRNAAALSEWQIAAAELLGQAPPSQRALDQGAAVLFGARRDNTEWRTSRLRWRIEGSRAIVEAVDVARAQGAD